jgi:uncharacterized membrane protein YoaK (UPF0700 family)
MGSTERPELNSDGRQARTSNGAAGRALSASTVRDLLLVGLSVSSGAVDAISYLALGKVFTAFMTGNVVFLGLRIGGAGGQDVARVVISLAAFATGVFVAVKIVKASRGSAIWPRRVSIALGCSALAQAGFLAGWLASSGRPSTGVGDLLVGVSALAMGAQSGAVLSLGVPGVFTTAATATVVQLVGDFAGWPPAAKQRGHLAGILVGVAAGAAGAVLLLDHARSWAPVLPLLATLAVIALARAMGATETVADLPVAPTAAPVP